jgi:hypothetical protein
MTEVPNGDAETGPQAALRERISFRSGDIAVLRLDGADMATWLNFFLR